MSAARKPGWLARLKHWFRRCGHRGCWQKGRECFIPNWDAGHDEIEYYCGDHAHDAGFCPSCGQFLAGVERFDFSKTGLCENCEDQLRHDLGEDDYDDEDESW